jgi:hypothetical protein
MDTFTTVELGEAVHLRGVYLRDIAHIQTMEAMAEAINTGLLQIAEREDGRMARGNTRGLLNHLQALRHRLDREVDEQTDKIEKLREEVTA